MSAAKSLTFTVDGDPVPWSVPDVAVGVAKGGRRYRRVKKDPRLEEWQGVVAEAARDAWGPWENTKAAVALLLHFILFTDDTSVHGQYALPAQEWNESLQKDTIRGKRIADLTNLTKGVEDAMQGVIYKDDTQIRQKTESCVWGPTAGVVVSVLVLEAHAFPTK